MVNQNICQFIVAGVLNRPWSLEAHTTLCPQHLHLIHFIQTSPMEVDENENGRAEVKGTVWMSVRRVKSKEPR
jgi:hypothetical protein